MIVTPTMVDFVNPGVATVYASSEYGASYLSWRAFDKTANGWLTGDEPCPSVYLILNNPIKINSYSVTPAVSGDGGTHVKSWKLYTADTSETFIIRCMTGGTIYNEMVNTNIGYGGKPPINEWDKYIINSNLKSKIVAGDNSMWHWNNNISTMCQDSLNIANATTLIKTLRGPYYYNGSTYGANKANYFSNSSLTATGTYMGFRPVLEYKEPIYKSTNLWY